MACACLQALCARHFLRNRGMEPFVGIEERRVRGQRRQHQRERDDRKRPAQP